MHNHLGRSPVDPVNPFLMSDSHEFRKGAEKIIRRCTSEAENYVLPQYLEMWKRYEPGLSKIINYALDTTLELKSPSPKWNREELDGDMIQYGSLYSKCPEEFQEELFNFIKYVFSPCEDEPFFIFVGDCFM